MFSQQRKRTSRHSYREIETEQIKQTKKTVRRKRTSFSWIVLLLFAGVFLGSLLSLFGKDSDLFFLELDLVQTCKNPMAYFFQCFIQEILLTVILYFMGFWAVAGPVIGSVIIVWGISIGLSTASVYGTYGIVGVIFCLLLYSIPITISSLALLFGAEQAFTMSMFYFTFTFDARATQLPSGRRIVKTYSVNFLTIIPWLIVVGVLRLGLSYGFGEFIKNMNSLL